MDLCDHHRSYLIGEVCDMPDDQAARWLVEGLAEPANDDPEAATLEAGERAVMPRARKRG